ncbi:hypothetical protein J3F83DRAFT_95223 [Trichoderma novae-zelandiae]
MSIRPTVCRRRPCEWVCCGLRAASDQRRLAFRLDPVTSLEALPQPTRQVVARPRTPSDRQTGWGPRGRTAGWHGHRVLFWRSTRLSPPRLADEIFHRLGSQKSGPWLLCGSPLVSGPQSACLSPHAEYCTSTEYIEAKDKHENHEYYIYEITVFELTASAVFIGDLLLLLHQSGFLPVSNIRQRRLRISPSHAATQAASSGIDGASCC